MVGSMEHEAFYASGMYAAPEMGVYGGWVAHENSFAAGQVFFNEQKDVALIFSGECFVDNEVRTTLKQKGYQLENNKGDWLVHLYEEEGDQFFEKLNGLFSGLLIDKRKDKVFLFNDRYGIERVYYYEANGEFYFASEAKALLRILPELRAFDEHGVAHFLTFGCPLEWRTLFRDVQLLPGGSVWTFKSGKCHKQKYFSPETWEAQPALSIESFESEFQESFKRILPHYFESDSKIGISLTAGLDTRMIMAWARPNHGGMPCYTFNGSYRDCADVRIARKVAAACGQPHHTISVGDEFLAQFPQLAEQTVRISDGAMNVTGAVELYVNRLARRIAPVRLTGNYGSEILRGQVALKQHSLFPDIFSTQFVPQLEAAARTYSDEAVGNRLSFIAFKEVPWYHYARLAVEKSQISLRSPFLDNDLVALAFRAPNEAVSGLPSSLRLIAQGNPALGRIPTDRGISYPADRITNRVHYLIEEFLARAEYAYDYGMPNWLARIDKVLMPCRLEKLFLGRQKFCHFRIWYRDRLAPYIREILLDSRSLSRPYLQRREVERMVAHHVDGQGNFTTELNKLLTLELTQRLLLERA
jgi:asparagine synthase (glutamine-hydrolysing)